MRRRAVVVFPVGGVVADIEAVRQRWDPVMAARIAPHVTIVHDVTDHGRAEEVLAAIAAVTAPFAATVTTTFRWGRGLGIYLPVTDSTGTVVALHDALAPVESPGWLRHGFRPHVTVVHARYVDAERAEAAWRALDGWAVERAIGIDRVAVVEMDTDGWATVDELPLTGPGRAVASPGRSPAP